MAEGGVPVDEMLVQLGGYRAEDSVMPAHDLLEPHDRPTAVFAANDQSALEIVHVALELGLEVPGDLSVVGFDNIPESALSAPPLTTVAQPIQQMGIRAVETLIAMIGGAEPPPRVTLPTEFVLRQSTAPPSGNSSTSDAL
jgi:LacI family transcriptional regulator